MTPWTAACQASLSITNSWSLLKLMPIESVMPSSHLIHCHPLLILPSIFPSIRVFPMSRFFTSGGQNIGVSASTSVLPMNIQDRFPLGWTGCPQKLKSCPTLCDPMDYSVHGILQAKIKEWVAFPFSRGSSQPRDRTQVSHIADSLPEEQQGKPRKSI